MNVPIEQCKSAKVYKKSTTKFLFWLSLAILLYSIVLPYAYITAGEPRSAAIINAQNIADEKWVNQTLLFETNNNSIDEVINEKVDIVTKSENLEVDETEVDFDVNAEKKSSSFFAGFFGPSKDQKRAQKELEDLKKKFSDLSEGGDISLPPLYLPSAGACISLFLLILGHSLFHLLCHWIVGFKAAVLYSSSSSVETDSFVLVTPPSSRGQPALVPVKRSLLTQTLFIEFQRQIYIYTSVKQLGSYSKDYQNGVFTLTPCPLKSPIHTYLQSIGLKSDQEVALFTEKYGKNHLAVPLPSFLELLQLQLLSPLAIFQVFCSILWLLDEYWSYTLWTLGSVVVFEAMTVFQRTRTQAMLSGMAPKPSPIYVYRLGRWQILSTKDLLPGDIISLAMKRVSDTSTTPAVPTSPTPGTTPPTPNANALESNNIVPCDCVLLVGEAVVNEASLTGESVPQMKDSLTVENDANVNNVSVDDVEKLDMNRSHRVHCLFSGTTLVAVGNQGAKNANSSSILVPPSPDNGALAYVLRTGFYSSQGSLLQMIEFSQQSVNGDVKETGLALLLLLFFALLAAAYVLKVGLEKREKTTHELLLKCVIIITSVVPRQFPMQMAMAVNMALMALNKSGIFCTEPFRVPLAGKITHCLFDKTGTLTTDQMSPVGIIDASQLIFDSTSSSSSTAGSAPVSVYAPKKINLRQWPSALPCLSSVASAWAEASMILSACHSLVEVESVSNANSEPSGEINPDIPAVHPSKKQLVGDPIELAALQGVEWSWNASNSTATPGAWELKSQALVTLRQKIHELQILPKEKQGPNHGQLLKSHLDQAVNIENAIRNAQQRASEFPYSSVQVVHRHHFSSKLQRMSVVCRCVQSSSKADVCYSFVKGSPEAIQSLLIQSETPSWYADCYEALAQRGLRVLALAYKKLTVDDILASHGSDYEHKSTSGRMKLSDAQLRDLSRSSVESNLHFAGFIAFECKIRSDSGLVIQSLLDSNHRVAMVTGDAVLTSLHVAREVNICSSEKDSLILKAIEDEEKSLSDSVKTDLGVFWEVHRYKPSLSTKSDEQVADSSTKEKKHEHIEFRFASLESLSKSYNILATEKALFKVASMSGGNQSPLWGYLEYFQVLSRMSPQGKASVIQALQLGHLEDELASLKSESNKNSTSTTKSSRRADDVHVLMCGDGGNDVGALKQANVGLALLSGHANANTTETLSSSDDASSKEKKADDTNANAEASLNAHQQKLEIRTAAINNLRQQHMKEFQAKYTKEQQAKMQEEIRRLTEAGQYTGMFSLMKNQAAEMKKAMDEENRRFMAKHGQVWDPSKDSDGVSGFGSLLGSMDNMDSGTLPMIRPGDASVAAPFTSRIPSIRAVVDLIRQGRCTLLSALMQQQIMMLESIISAYTLSALSLHNARSSERQMMASSWLIMTAAVSFSYSTPVKSMHPLRPLRSLFHPAVIVSTLGQALIHVLCMTLAVRWATEAMGEAKLAEVTEFFRKARAHEIDRTAHCGEDDLMCLAMAYWTSPFLPNLLNSVVFLVETSQMISVFFANYKGRPWMNGMMENHALFLSVFLCVAGVIVAAWEMIPALNDLLQLTPFPEENYFRYRVVLLVMSTIVGTLLWDRLCVRIWAPEVSKATWEEIMKTSFSDFLPILKTVGLIALGLFVLGTGNILLAGAAFWFYRSYTNKLQQQKQQQALANP